VKNADAIVATTSDDAANLSIGVAARSVNPRIRVVLRIADAEFARKLATSKALDRLISTPATSAPAFVGAAIHPGAVSSFVHNGRLITLIESQGTNADAIMVQNAFFEIRSVALNDDEIGSYFEV
jgi:Trk K+ transport system NAD-binding subunit